MGNKNPKEIGVGVIGFGGFAMFAVQHMLQIPGVKLIGIAETHRQAADTFARRFDAVHYNEIEDLLHAPGVDLIYIATPPFLHYSQSMMALRAGKHVLCEKPLALTVEQGTEMIETAKEKGLLMSVNLIQRYNPIYQKISRLIEDKVLGEVLHAYFENYARDEFLPPEHWFWDKEKSGGIFIEHGVHFFDMFTGWFGDGKITSAQSTIRPGTGFEEQLQCQVAYDNGVLVNFYHGFHQAGRMDRQEMRLLFERGDVTLYEWIPFKGVINALVDESDSKKLIELFDDSQLQIASFFQGHERKISYRHKEDDIYQMLSLRFGFEKQKMYIYGDCVKALFADQIEWIRNRGHKRIITETNGLESLKHAADASKIVNATVPVEQKSHEDSTIIL